MKYWSLLALATVIGSCVASVAAWAQSGPVPIDISIELVTGQGVPVEGAAVSLKSKGGPSYGPESVGAGQYHFLKLPAAEYQLTVDCSGYFSRISHLPVSGKTGEHWVFRVPMVEYQGRLPASFEPKALTVTLRQEPPFGWGKALSVVVSGTGKLHKTVTEAESSGKSQVLVDLTMEVQPSDVLAIADLMRRSGFERLPPEITQIQRLALDSDGTVRAGMAIPMDVCRSTVEIRVGESVVEVADTTGVDPVFNLLEERILALAKEKSLR